MENPTQSISDHGWEQYFLDMKVTKKKKSRRRKPILFQLFFGFPHLISGHVLFYYDAVRQAKPKKGNFFAGCEADSSPPRQIPKLLGPTAPAVCTQASAPCTRTALMSQNTPAQV